MVSSRKQQANRTNAKRSTGPRTAEGKARASRNALGHGLAIPITANQTFQAEINQLARAIVESCGPGANLDLATRVAEAQVDLNRVRCARNQLISRALQENHAPDNAQPVHTGDLSHTFLCKLLFNRETSSKILRAFAKDGAAELAESLEERHARLLDSIAKELNALGRYESRALSRRKFAVRALDAALSQPTEASAARFESAAVRDRR